MNTRLKELGGIENLETVNKFDSFWYLYWN
jgi:hypothetical protein